ncbi:AAA family ATPase [Hymenobacter coccineus]|uniref:AAA family ATPase n=1 Tax=Hymenobacter coccineus TaxID=1908235 RepID=UPI0013014E22|nr:ATP-binding protein [Hymenobacter coccineus]
MAKKSKAPAPEVPTVSEQPYYLQRAHIKDFRSIRDTKVDFKPGLNIIIGPNGSGKTNFVRCIQNGLGELQPDFLGKVNLSINGRDKLEIESAMQDNLTTNPFKNYNSTSRNRQQTIRLLVKGKEFEANSFQEAFIESKFTGTKPYKTKLSLLQLVTIAHGIPNRYPIVDTAEDFEINFRSIGYNIDSNSLFSQLFASGIARSFLSIHALSGERQKLPSHEAIHSSLNEVEKFYLSRLLPELRLFTPINDIQLTASYNTYTNSIQQQIIIKGIRLDFKIIDDWLPFSALSSGTQRLFYIISEIIASFLFIPTEDPHQLDNYDRILLLEEPELGIHPDQLEKLLLFLRQQSKKHQIIITTHSPQVLDMLEEDELDRITICELDQKKGTQFRKLKKAQIVTAKKYMQEIGFLSDYWRHGTLETNN